MTERLLIAGLLILSVLVLSCGPTAGPRNTDGASSERTNAIRPREGEAGLFKISDKQGKHPNAPRQRFPEDGAPAHAGIDPCTRGQALSLGLPEALLYGPAGTRHPHQVFQGCVRWTEADVIGQLFRLGNAAANQ